MKGIRVIATYKCNIMCSNCRYGCSPSKKGIMDPLRFENEVSSAYNEGFRDYLIIDGGEPFLYTSFIYKYLKKIKYLDVKKYIVTNGHWGQTDTFIDILSELKNFGLDGIIIEYDYYHSVFLDELTIREAISKGAVSSLEIHMRASFNTDGIKDEADVKTFEFIRRIKEEENITGFIFEKSRGNNSDLPSVNSRAKYEKVIHY